MIEKVTNRKCPALRIASVTLLQFFSVQKILSPKALLYRRMQLLRASIKMFAIKAIEQVFDICKVNCLSQVSWTHFSLTYCFCLVIFALQQIASFHILQRKLYPALLVETLLTCVECIDRKSNDKAFGPGEINIYIYESAADWRIYEFKH